MICSSHIYRIAALQASVFHIIVLLQSLFAIVIFACSTKTILIMKKILLLAIAAIPFFTGCRKNQNPDPPKPGAGNGNGTVMPKGTVTGTAVSKTIGAGGGSFTSSDGGVTITIPAGAVSANTSFSVQRITNALPTSLGLNYRLLPEGTHFNQPVTISFHYTDSLIEGAREEDLLIATQDSAGVWQAYANTILDKTKKTLAVKSTHFSDWSAVSKLRMVVDKPSIDFGEKATLMIRGLGSYIVNDGLISIDSNDKVADITWKLSGEGNLNSLAPQIAYYTALSDRLPNPNPVTVYATVNLGMQGIAFLQRSVYVGKTFMEVVLNGNTNIYPNCQALVLAQMVQISAFNNAGNGGGFYIPLSGTGTYVWGEIPYAGFDVNYTIGGAQFTDNYMVCAQPAHYEQTHGTVTITKWGTDYIEGSYSGNLVNVPTGTCGDNAPPKLLSGRFKAKRVN